MPVLSNTSFSPWKQATGSVIDALPHFNWYPSGRALFLVGVPIVKTILSVVTVVPLVQNQAETVDVCAVCLATVVLCACTEEKARDWAGLQRPSGLFLLNVFFVFVLLLFFEM